MVVLALRRQTVMAIALDFVPQCADLLAMTEIAAFPDIDIAALQFERRIGPHAVDMLDRAVDPEERGDLDGAADRDHDQDSDQQKDRIAFQPIMVHRAGSTISAIGTVSFGESAVAVFQRLKAMISVPARYSPPPIARMM